MKKIVFLVIVFCVTASYFARHGYAQDSGIRFEENTDWERVVKKAAGEKKLIFIDCYTSWCGPCQFMSQTIFPKKEVGNFFNANFINVKYDMEKDSSGVQLCAKYQVHAYPTLLFIDPATEELVHKAVGAVNVSQLLAIGEQAMDPNENLRNMKVRYLAGERGAEFLKGYFVTLMFAGDKQNQGKVALEYIDCLTIKDLAEKENWGFLSNFSYDPLSKIVGDMLDSLDYTYQVIGEEKASEYLYNVFNGAVHKTATWGTQGGGVFDENRNDELTARLKKFDNKYVPGMLATLSTAKYVRQQDFKGMLNAVKKNLRTKVFVEQRDVTYYCIFMDQLVLCENNKILQKGIDWLQEKFEETEDLNLKSNYIRRIGNLLKKQGKEEEAMLAFADAENYMKLWREENQRKVQ